jgi:CheY-like chemotaxis protein
MPESATVLVAEDTAPVRRFLRRVLEMEGYRVNEASDGVEALALFTTKGHDVVVVDIRMPNMDGHELARELRKRSASVPILFVSGYDAYIEHEDLPGPVLAKPFMPEALVASIRRLLPGPSSKKG